MKIDLQTSCLSRSQLQDVGETVRAMFRDVAHRVSRVVVAVSQRTDKRHVPCHCVVEVHMVDGRVERIEERQRRLRSALRRAVLRAWRSVVRSIVQQLPQRKVLRLPAAARAADPAGGPREGSGEHRHA